MAHNIYKSHSDDRAIKTLPNQVMKKKRNSPNPRVPTKFPVIFHHLVTALYTRRNPFVSRSKLHHHHRRQAIYTYFETSLTRSLILSSLIIFAREKENLSTLAHVLDRRRYSIRSCAHIVVANERVTFRPFLRRGIYTRECERERERERKREKRTRHVFASIRLVDGQ